MAMHASPQSAPALQGQDLPVFQGISVAPGYPLDIINVRGRAEDAAFLTAMSDVLDVRPPATPNTWAAVEGGQILWCGPDEWLLVVDQDGPAGRADALRTALGNASAAVTSVGAGWALLELTGERVREILARGVPLDLHPSGFGPGQCVQTRLAHATIMLWQMDDTPTFRLMIRRSMATYLRDWLVAIQRRTEAA